MPASLNVIFCEVLSFLLSNTVRRENLYEHLFFFIFPLRFCLSNFLIYSIAFKTGDLLLQSGQQFRLLQVFRLKILEKLKNFLKSILVFSIMALEYRILFGVNLSPGFRKIKVDWAVEITIMSLCRLEDVAYFFLNYIL